MNNQLIIFILILGVIYRLFLIADGNFLFNMDNARDMVDVREMVELGKIRLTGPTSAIEGLYNGPLWYYLLAIPYIASGGDPYSAIIMEIILWAIGGFFLLKLIKNFSRWLILPIGLVWVASNYIVLQNLYAFNPNPVTFLTPLFIYGLVEYLKKGNQLWIILTWFLAGAFFNFEMNFGIFTPLIIFLSLFFVNKNYFKDKYFWIGIIVFILTLFPQLFFDLRHQFLMSKSIIKFLTERSAEEFNLIKRAAIIWETFFNVFQATMMNHKYLSWIILILAIPAFRAFIKNNKKDIKVVVTTIFVVVPFTLYLIIPVTVNAWHLGGFASASLILIVFIFSKLWPINFLGKIFALSLSIILIAYSVSNIFNFFLIDLGKPSMDPSLYKNEIAAIDYVYNFAKGQNFKAYIYLPSVYDYPYQYLIWWHGLKKYGYLPADYAYAPEKFEYISNKQSFSATEEELKKRENSNLVFLIKEPNRNYTRYGWEGDFIKYNWETIEKQMVGPIEIEVRREINQ